MAPTATKNGSRQPRFSKTETPAPITRRSGVTTGSRLYISLRNRNTPLGRRFADIISLLVSDQGGTDYVSEARKIITRRAAFCTVQLELLEERVAKRHKGVAPPHLLVLYGRIANALRRHLEALGLERRMRDATPTLQQYLSKKYGSEEDDATAEQ